MAGNHNSGRKTDGEIIKKYVNAQLANNIANKELKRIDEKETATLDELKTVVMPIVLKDMTEKQEINGNITINLDSDINNKYATDSEPEDNSEGPASI